MCTASGASVARGRLKSRGRASGVETGLRADEPLFAAAGQSFATLPQGERLLEGGRALFEFVHHPDQLVTGLFI